MLSPSSVLKKQSSKFKSLDIWKQLKDDGNDLSWYLAVSTWLTGLYIRLLSSHKCLTRDTQTRNDLHLYSSADEIAYFHHMRLIKQISNLPRISNHIILLSAL